MLVIDNTHTRRSNITGLSLVLFLFLSLLSMMAGIEVSQVEHERFKALTANAVAVVRTGECTPYANIILKSGVFF